MHTCALKGLHDFSLLCIFCFPPEEEFLNRALHIGGAQEAFVA